MINDGELEESCWCDWSRRTVRVVWGEAGAAMMEEVSYEPPRVVAFRGDIDMVVVYPSFYSDEMLLLLARPGIMEGIILN